MKSNASDTKIVSSLNSQKFFQIIVPIRTVDNVIIKNLLKSIEENSEYINSVIFVVEENAIENFNVQVSNSAIDNFKIIEIENLSSKLRKLEKTLQYLASDKFVIVLDEDDELIELSKMCNWLSAELKLSGGVDLILTPLTIEFHGKKMKKTFAPANDTWESSETFPYFNNHNCFPTAEIFKSFFENNFKFDFQKHESVFRSIVYMNMTKKYLVSNDFQHSIIKYNIFENREHSSLTFDFERTSLDMNALIKNIIHSIFSLSNDSFLQSSQINAYKRIFRTIYMLNQNNGINTREYEDIYEFSKKMKISFKEKDLFHTEELIFNKNEAMINGKILKH